MRAYTVILADEAALFYEKAADQAGRSVEQVLGDSLYKLAGELALEALHGKTFDPEKDRKSGEI